MRQSRWPGLLALLFVVGLVAPPNANAHPYEPAVAACLDQPLPGGATGRFCVPGGAAWGGDVIVYVPGFSPTGGFRNLELPDGTALPDLVTGLGYAFATTNVGLVDDTAELMRAFPAAAGRPARRVYLAGVSQGGLVVTQLAERPQAVINGALAICGPIGDYRRQIDYFGDFRALFDYFFPGVLPPTAVDIPTQVQDGWESAYRPAVVAALAADPAAANQLIGVSQAAVDDTSPSARATSIVSTTVGALWYNIFATGVARVRYGGNAYDNSARVYTGSSDDAALNQGLVRYSADATARVALEREQTAGRPTVPLVILHTAHDEIVPAWHAMLYQAKAQQNGARAVSVTVVDRYGHCNLTSSEILTAFLQLTHAADSWRWQVALPVVSR